MPWEFSHQGRDIDAAFLVYLIVPDVWLVPFILVPERLIDRVLGRGGCHRQSCNFSTPKPRALHITHGALELRIEGLPAGEAAALFPSSGGDVGESRHAPKRAQGPIGGEKKSR